MAYSGLRAAAPGRAGAERDAVPLAVKTESVIAVGPGVVAGSIDPGLKLQVEGYTDSIGSDEYNQKLSEERADTVRDYLVNQSVQSTNITAEGYGKTHPIADNSTASGRAENRRVQLVVSGNAIGVPEQPPAPGGSSQNQPAPAAQPTPATRQGFTGNIPQSPVSASNPH